MSAAKIWRSTSRPRRELPVHTAGGIQLFRGRGRCWLCGHSAALFEKLPGKRHASRGLCTHHAEATYGKDVVAAVLHTPASPQ